MEKLTLILGILAVTGTVIGIVRAFIKEAKEAIDANVKLAKYAKEAFKDGLTPAEKKELLRLLEISANETLEAYDEGLKLWNVIKKQFFNKKK
ncbi:MAG: hypothetical protein WC389_18985 [Lutibacter sp.]|jgi:hypothetical protein